MKARERRIFEEVLNGRGFVEVPKEIQDEGFGCHCCTAKGRQRTYYCDFSLIPSGHDTVSEYRRKVDEIRFSSWCAHCFIWYYKEK